ncbi:MAG: hypothetical protein ABII27_01150 [bacterium]
MMTAKHPVKGFGIWFLMLFGWQVFVFSFIQFENLGYLSGRYYLWFAPVVILYAIGFFGRLISTWTWKLTALIVLGFLLWNWAVGFKSISRSSDHPSHQSVGNWPEIIYLRDKIPPNARVLTNIPAQIAWYAKKETILIPYDPGETSQIIQDWPVEYFFLSYHRIGELGNFNRWLTLLRNKNSFEKSISQMGFTFEKAFKGGLLFRREIGSPIDICLYR